MKYRANFSPTLNLPKEKRRRKKEFCFFPVSPKNEKQVWSTGNGSQPTGWLKSEHRDSGWVRTRFGFSVRQKYLLL
ncbi:MAG: hypothetical protein AMJ95_04070 [Omnitrophica WOR_2 bacterium SM23_72]|nr:MAG: hypothetical protein AMJ95_04070 [Omnitrophica WOR_2 bacterium SM23_72]